MAACINIPEVNGENSKMYIELKKILNDRPLTNYIYSSYLASNTHDAMLQATNPNGTPKYKENSQGEFKAKDLLDFLQYYGTMARERRDMSTEEFTWGLTDASGNRVEFTDAKKALELAKDFNDHHTGLVSIVFSHGAGKYNVVAYQKNSRTFMYAADVESRLLVWDMYKQAFMAVGVDIENLPPDASRIFNAYNTDIAQTLKNIQLSRFTLLDYNEALAMFSVDPHAPFVQRLIGVMGSIEKAAQAVDDIIHGRQKQTGPNTFVNYTANEIRLAQNAVQQAQNFRGIDLTALQTQAAQMLQNANATSPQAAIQNTLRTLNKKYGIEVNELNLTGKEITSLSRAAAEAVIQIDRRIRELEKVKGNIAEGKRLEALKNQLLMELNNKKYYSGLLSFLKEGLQALQIIDGYLTNTPQTGTELEKAYEQSKALTNIKQLKDQYYSIIEALAAGNITIDESINQIDVDNLVSVAKHLKEQFESKQKVITELGISTMITLLREFIGDTAPNGQAIENIVKMAQIDSSWWDYLYSVGRASNPVVGTMGAIILKAKMERDAIMNKISRRVRGEESKLRKSGSSSEFIYADEEHLLSDIDWNAYEEAYKNAAKQFGRQGLWGYDHRQAMANWEEAHTEDRVVDKTNGRTERVPNKQFRLNNGLVWDDVNHTMTFSPSSGLTAAQQEYYNNMMAIKGELGSYFPAHAQIQYRAPQVRRNFVDAISAAKSADDYLKAVKTKLSNFFTVREDDTNYGFNSFNSNGIAEVDGEEYKPTNGGYDNTAYKSIPIFFMNKVEDGELLKDFSTGLQHLAGTAVNYDAVSSVAQVVEFVGDFAVNNLRARNEADQRDIVGNKFIKVIKQLDKKARNTNTEAMIMGFMDHLLYGNSRDPNENKYLSKMADNLVYYTSMKGLSLNLKGALSNYLVGEFQMLIEAGAGEFYGFRDYAWAHTKLFGKAGVAGEVWDLMTDNMNSKANLLGELFDPLRENFTNKMGKRYHQSLFRRLMANDCTFIGYATGEYLIHYVNMYGVLHHEKALLNGKKVALYNVFDVQKDKDGNSTLVIKQGATQLDGSAITQEYLEEVRNKIAYCNDSTHGSMSSENKGLIHRKWAGRMAMNFRQWMVEHYSRRFRKKHFDYTLGKNREGYWYSVWKGFAEGEGWEAWEDKHKAKALALFMRDAIMFAFRAQSQWSHLDEMQQYNVKRANTEFLMWLALCGLSFALGEPDEHKKEFWRRWWIYQVKRLILDTEASMPHPQMPKNMITILQSPMAGISVLNSMLYCIYGIDDITEEIKSGPHKGENRYWRTIKKNALPFFKDIEQLQTMDTSDAIFTPFTNNNPNR